MYHAHILNEKKKTHTKTTWFEETLNLDHKATDCSYIFDN